MFSRLAFLNFLEFVKSEAKTKNALDLTKATYVMLSHNYSTRISC